MMALIGLVLFTSALGVVAGVLWFTLLPALPRMVAIVRDSLVDERTRRCPPYGMDRAVIGAAALAVQGGRPSICA